MGDVFNGNSSSPTNAQFGASPSVCNDPQISQIEKSSGTTARVFEPAASGSKQGRFGRWLETNGYVNHTGVCAGTGYLVMFIYNSKISNANRVANEYFASNSSPQNKPPDSRTTDEEWKRRCDYEKKNHIEWCGTWSQQRGNFDGNPGCTPLGVENMYKNCIASNPDDSRTTIQGRVIQDDRIPARGSFRPVDGSNYGYAKTPTTNNGNSRTNNREQTRGTRDSNPTSQLKIANTAQSTGAKGYFLLGTAKSGECVYSGKRLFNTGRGSETIYVCIGNHRAGEIISGEIYPIGSQSPYFTYIEGFFKNNTFYVTRLNNVLLRNKDIPLKKFPR